MKKRRKIKAKLLTWKPHHVRNNGTYGMTATGNAVCYVYQPFDNRIRRGAMPWQVHCYFGPRETPLTGTARYGKFPTAQSAKLAAQRWWQSQMEAMTN